MNATDKHEYFKVPKLFTWAGLRCQARGVANITRAIVLTMAGKTPASRTMGRTRAIAYTLRIWIEYWYVRKRKGWVRADDC